LHHFFKFANVRGDNDTHGSKPWSLIVVVLSLAGSASSGEKACLLNFDSRRDYGLPQMMCELGK